MSTEFVSQSFGAGFDTNAYVLFASESRDAVIVDPGKGSREWCTAMSRGLGLTVHAVLLTHGHMDHSWDAQPIADLMEVPVFVGEKDQQMLVEPEAGLPADFPPSVLRGYPRVMPSVVRDAMSSRVTAGELRVESVAAPGHTAGSQVFLFGEGSELMCTGDAYLGSAPARAIQPTGDSRALVRSIRLVRRLVDHADVVLPGHGPATWLRGTPRPESPLLTG
ncbi:MBL fold metallo-hydrolase [Rathayibacter iranicus]|uniref:MBL fold metallo-hydrolase n=1 Tax=Rathayibacter iranicus TaxID=59737 RepID=UPI000CE8A8B5|nr:MBL fold metallo-hydrolase [Rathayibacter iranicus]PPI68763.1 hypothetical protein C5E01_12970 [Rathayibacter iranicus]